MNLMIQTDIEQRMKETDNSGQNDRPALHTPKTAVGTNFS